MDQSTSASRPSGIPRPSRLPVRVPELRPTASRENLQSSRLAVHNPRLRSSASREQLSAPTSSRPHNITTPVRRESSQFSTRDREYSASYATYTPTTRPLLRKPSNNALSKQPSKASLRDLPVRLEIRPEEDMARADEASPVDEQPYEISIRKPRPSLSERTMETLQNIPSSPALRKRRSSFFNSENPARPPSQSLSRPTSSSNSNTSGNSTPMDFRASTNTFRPPQTILPPQTPMKRPSTGISLKTPGTGRKSILPTEASASKLPSPGPGLERSPSPTKSIPGLPVLKSGSRTLSSNPLKPRASINGLFRKPSMPLLNQSSELDRIGFGVEKPTTFSNTSSEATSVISKSSNATSVLSGDEQDTTPRKSSLALRDQIAKAKAAKRAAAAKQEALLAANNGEEIPVIPSGTFDFGLIDDPFNKQINQDGVKGLLRKRIQSARTDGRLNIAAMGFKEIPEEVLNMYNLDAIGTADGSWAESVDLTRFIAADNEMEVIPDEVFPDVDPKDAMNDEDTQGNQFGGLEMLDLHGNILIALPVGLRRLQFLTTLNLSNNKLSNDTFQVISQLRSLKDLKMGGNELVGPVDDSITNLVNLEFLDLQRNALTLLPDALADLVRLRVLNLTENKFKSLPFEALRRLPLTEISAAKNNLTGSLVAEEVDELPRLQILDVTANSLTSLTLSGNLKLPSLHQLSCSCNRITKLPNLESWTSLITIAAEDNNIDSIPEGFTSLTKLKNVDFNGNNIRVLDDRIGAMENLDVLRVSGNPLRDKKFSGMTTEELKRALKGRMEPEEEESDKEYEHEQDQEGAFYSAPVSPMSPPRPTSSDWQVKPGGILDRSGTKSFSLNPVAAADVAAFNQIKVVELHHNLFKEIPASIAFFAATLTILNISHNELNSDTFLIDDLELPTLKELNLSSNTFNSLQPLIQRLKAPNLERLDISFNRLTSLPILKSHFPNLITLLASHNTIRELSPESIKGLQTVDCSSNDINSLNARIGLLGGPGGLQRLDVSGNRFRVPKYTVLEKGTEATLQWLRDRIPIGEATSPTDVD